MEFCLLEPERCGEAYYWHRGFAGANEFLLPRPWDVYERLADEGRIWCARENSRDYAALTYFDFDKPHAAWEIGGLMVSAQMRGKGIASVLARLALADLLFSEDPLVRGERIVMHVHRENPAPRGVIQDALKFQRSGEIKVPGTTLPGLKRDEEGYVVGDEFQITKPASLLALAEWCDTWTGTLRDRTPAPILFAPHISMNVWSQAFRDMAKR